MSLQSELSTFRDPHRTLSLSLDNLAILPDETDEPMARSTGTVLAILMLFAKDVHTKRKLDRIIKTKF